MRTRILSLLLIACCFSAPAFAKAPIPLLLDTDIGTDVDDAFALGLVLASPELKLLSVTTVGEKSQDRAWMVCRFLTQSGRDPVPVAWGRDPQPRSPMEWQIQYRRHPAVIFNRTCKPAKESAVDLLYNTLKANKGATLLAIGPLTNIARLLTKHPDCKPWIKKLVLMGGSVKIGYNGKPPPVPEWNIKSDIDAAKTVFTFGVPLVIAPLDATLVQLDNERRERIFNDCSRLTYQLQALYQLWNQPTPTLFDPVAVSLCFDEQFCTMKDLHLTVDEKGITRIGNGKPNARVATAIKTEAFLDWIEKRLTAEKTVLPSTPKNLSTLIDRKGFPTRVHTFEDYETDIEKRWWMSGKLETKNVPPGSRRACRAVITQDFDDRMGQTKTAYKAVIFNPVPGPPMGPKTRLSFRYWLKGTDRMRVQLYSLSKGYHRYLSLKGLPQEKWQSGTVDMTAMRRPDGSGGPLAENERIDDIQFYVDPRAELIIDDIVLYEEAEKGEKRPFPSRFMFTGWFDTGKQGKEWPGTFRIPAQNEKPGVFWKAAQSVKSDQGNQVLRIHLRGKRSLGSKPQLFFRYYRLTGTDGCTVVLKEGKLTHRIKVISLQQGKWGERNLDLGLHLKSKIKEIDNIEFRLPAGAELLLDDVLLYE